MITFLVLILAFVAGSLYAEDPLIVFFIDPTYAEYSGDAMLVCTPGGRHFVIDAGMYSGYSPPWDCGMERVLPLLDSLGVTYLDGAVGTHPHADHIGGLISVYESLPVVTAYDSGWPYEASWTYENYLQAIWNNGSDYVTPRRGDYLNWDPALTVEVIHPVEPLSPSNTNNSSIVIRLTYEEVSFLFTGDLETNGGEDVILAALSTGDIEDISADVLKVGHHGSHTSTCTQWLVAVNPSIAAICLGAGNPYGHPHTEVMNRLNDRGITIYRTDLDGTFYISSDGEGVYYNTMPPDSGGSELLNEFAVYPSPATTQATFSWNSDNSQHCSINIFNLNGEKVFDVQAAGGVYTWDFSTDSGVASPGLYAVVFRTSGGEVFTEYFTVSR
ncbi:MAG: MBL fold metallo-hydrolase [Candidatus Aegiribacteria sp.]|nr:MBL fold metallo-hydrolase [Candidatus Aegiribacteria sp.]